MSLPGWVRALFVLLAVVTVGLKVVLNTSFSAASEAAVQERGKRLVAGFLEDRGYLLDETEGLAGSPFVTGVLGECRVTAVVAAADGWLSDSLGRLAGPGSRVFYVHAGAIYAGQPVWLTWYWERWRRLGRFVGRVDASAPTVGVVESVGCADEGVWRGLGLAGTVKVD